VRRDGGALVTRLEARGTMPRQILRYSPFNLFSPHSAFLFHESTKDKLLLFNHKIALDTARCPVIFKIIYFGSWICFRHRVCKWEASYSDGPSNSRSRSIFQTAVQVELNSIMKYAQRNFIIIFLIFLKD
jgi:hypothetical protein